MNVLQLYLRIFLKRGLGTTIMYICIFSTICMLTTALGQQEAGSFTAEKPDIGIVDCDNSPLSQALGAYLEENATRYPLADDADESDLRDGLYSGSFSYCILIPAGFADDFAAGGTGGIVAYKQTDADAALLAQHVEQYLKTASLYRDTTGIDTEKIAADLSTAVEVTMTGGKQVNQHGLAYYINYLVYPVSAILLFSITTVMLGFQEPEVQKRNLCAPIRPMKISMQLFAGNMLIGLMTLAALLGVIAARLPAVFDTPRWGLWLGNVLVFTLFCQALSFFVASFCKRSMISPISNFFSLAMSFLGGVFVPLDVMNQKLKAVLCLNPAYWFVRGNEAIEGLTDYSAASLAPVGRCVLIEVAFAAAFLSLALVRRRRVTAA